MTTTEPTTRVAPAWLNLDELCPPAVRAEIASVTEALGDQLREVEADVKKARHLLKGIDASHDEAQEYLEAQGVSGTDLHALIMTMTGGEDLWNAMQILSDAIDPDNFEKPYPVERAEVEG